MANLDQKTTLIDNAYEQIKNICKNLQKDIGVSILEVKSLLKLIWNNGIKRVNKKLFLDSGKVNHSKAVPVHFISKNKNFFD